MFAGNLQPGQTPASQYAGPTRRFPLRFCEPGVHLAPGKWFKVIASMGTCNPAFFAYYACNGQYTGYLYDENDRLLDSAESAIYIHVLSELP